MLTCIFVSIILLSAVVSDIWYDSHSLLSLCKSGTDRLLLCCSSSQLSNWAGLRLIKKEECLDKKGVVRNVLLSDSQVDIEYSCSFTSANCWSCKLYFCKKEISFFFLIHYRRDILFYAKTNRPCWSLPFETPYNGSIVLPSRRFCFPEWENQHEAEKMRWD